MLNKTNLTMKWTIVLLVFVLGALAVVSCSQAEKPDDEAAAKKSRAQEIIDQAIAAHGSEQLLHSTLEFDFRDYHYIMERNGGSYRYERLFTDTSGQRIHDVLTNESFTRTIDGEEAELTDKQANTFGNSVNSVIYFATLPLSLNDPAVQKEYLGEATIKEEPYHKIKVTFSQQGGGDDFQDEYIYWIHRDQYTMDYLAYNYETNGGGARFRQAYNVRQVEGVTFQDYYNLKPASGSLAVATFDSLFNVGAMEQVSVIETADVKLRIK